MSVRLGGAKLTGRPSGAAKSNHWPDGRITFVPLAGAWPRVHDFGPKWIHLCAALVSAPAQQLAGKPTGISHTKINYFLFLRRRLTWRPINWRRCASRPAWKMLPAQVSPAKWMGQVQPATLLCLGRPAAPSSSVGGRLALDRLMCISITRWPARRSQLVLSGVLTHD